jgi:hypothetical protein
MKAKVLTTASLLGAFAGTLPAADPQLMKLVMPDVKVMSDVNVAQAKLSPFGQFLLSQMESVRLQQFAAQTGFDPRQDLTELLLVSNGVPGAANSLVLASGVFNPVTIAAAAQAAGAASETYKGVTILDNSAKTEGVALLNGTIMIAGSVVNVKAAIDRQTAPAAALPASLATEANLLSLTQDAWAISTVSPASLIPAGAQKSPPIGGMAVPANVLQQVQSGYVGVKFGSNVTLTAQAQSDTQEDAAGLAGLLQLAGNIVQMQAAKNPDAAAFAKSLAVTALGATVNISASLPSETLQQLLTPKAAVKDHVKEQVQGAGK